MPLSRRIRPPDRFSVRLLSTVRSVSGQPCSPSYSADFRVHRPARHTRVCLRRRVRRKSTALSSVPPGLRPRYRSRLATSGARRLGLRLDFGPRNSLPLAAVRSPADSVADPRRDTALRNTASLSRWCLGAKSSNRSPGARSAHYRVPRRLLDYFILVSARANRMRPPHK